MAQREVDIAINIFGAIGGQRRVQGVNEQIMRDGAETMKRNEVMMSLHPPEHDATFRQSLWTFTVEQVQRIAGSGRAAQASVALWAFLHGAVAIEAAQVFGENKPASGLEFGLDAWLMAVSTRGEPKEARVKFPQGSVKGSVKNP